MLCFRMKMRLALIYSSELLLLDEKYEALVAMVLQIIETNASEISRLTSLIERMADKDG